MIFLIQSDADVCSFTNSITPSACDLNIKNLSRKLENNEEIAITQFECSYMKMNNDNVILQSHGQIWVKIRSETISETQFTF